MPRLAKSEREKQAEELIIRIEMLRMRNHYQQKEMLDKVGMPRTTYHNRKKHPETFTFGELQDFANLFNVSLEVLVAGRGNTASLREIRELANLFNASAATLAAATGKECPA